MFLSRGTNGKNTARGFCTTTRGFRLQCVVPFTSEGVIASPMQGWLLFRYWPHKTCSRKCGNITVADRVKNAWIPNRKSRVLPTQKHGQSLIVHKKVIIYDNLLLVIIGSGDVFHLLYSPTQPPPKKKSGMFPSPFVAAEGQQQIEAQVHEDLRSGIRDPRDPRDRSFFDEEMTQPGDD